MMGFLLVVSFVSQSETKGNKGAERGITAMNYGSTTVRVLLGILIWVWVVLIKLFCKRGNRGKRLMARYDDKFCLVNDC